MFKQETSVGGLDPSTRPPTWMRDIRRRLQRDLLVRQAQPGMATQAKVHYALQVRRRTQTQREGESVLSPSMIPFTSDEVNRLLKGSDAPSGVRGPQHGVGNGGPRTVGTHQLSVVAKLTDAVAREMAHRGYDTLSAQMLTSYMTANPAAIDTMRRDLKVERQQRRRERASAVLGHDHVLPEELLFGSRATAFPKAPMNASNSDLTSTRTGSVSKILKNCATMIEEEKTELEPLTLFATGERPRHLPPLRTVGRTAPPLRGSVLGDHFPIYVCQGIPITFDPPTIATLTAQGGRATEAIVAQQSLDVGALEMMTALEEVRLLRALHAPKAHVVTAKVSSGRHSVPLRPESRDGESDVHSLPNDPRHAISLDELLTIANAVEASHSQDAEKRHGAPAARVVEAPEGLLKQLLRDVDSDSEGSDDGMMHPRCVVCHSMQSQRGKKPGANSVRNLRDSSRTAHESLLRWKALHQLSHREATSSLEALLATRDEHSRVVTQNLGALAQVTAKANRDAEDWMRSRSGASPSPTGQSAHAGSSVWDGPCNHITTQRARWHGCVLFWERLRQFLELLQWPSSEGQLDILRRLQHVIETLKCLSPCVLLLWLHSCGPQLCRVREFYRVLVFVRCALAIPQSALHAWMKLPHIKNLGFEVASD